jgi:hypothetical protein
MNYPSRRVLELQARGAAGIHIARTTFQWYLNGPQAPLDQIEPGDLPFSGR